MTISISLLRYELLSLKLDLDVHLINNEKKFIYKKKLIKKQNKLKVCIPRDFSIHYENLSDAWSYYELVIALKVSCLQQKMNFLRKNLFLK